MRKKPQGRVESGSASLAPHLPIPTSPTILATGKHCTRLPDHPVIIWFFGTSAKISKNRAIWLADNGYPMEDICEILGVSQSSIYRWKKSMEENGSVIPPHNPIQGRPRILHGDQTQDLFAMMADAPELYLDEIQDWIASLSTDG